jgi:hypothetical protein
LAWQADGSHSVVISNQGVKLQYGRPVSMRAGVGQLKQRLFHGFVYNYKHSSVRHLNSPSLEVL